MKKEIKCSLILLTTAAIWGFAYVAQKLALGSVGPLMLNTLRGTLAWIFLIPCSYFLKWFDRKNNRYVRVYNKKLTIKSGIITGILLCLASVLQAYGIQNSEVGKAGFLTTLYIVLVPIISIFIGKRTNLKVWISVVMALIGTFFLCVKSGFRVVPSDMLLILCAVFFACNIVKVSTVCEKVDNVKMSMVQFFVSSMCSLIPALIFENTSWSDIIQALPVIAYSGIFSCGIGYTIEIIGQDGLNPTVASLILSFESVFSLLTGWVFLHEKLSGRELIGCGIVVSAVVLAQLPKKKSKEANVDENSIL